MTSTDPLNLDAIEAVIRNAAQLGADIDPGTAAALVAEVRRLRAAEAAAVTVRGLHKRRTERHGSGCVQCGIVWPCPTYLGLTPAAEGAQR